MISVRPIRSKEQLDVLNAAAKADGHVLVRPSHGVWRCGTVVGALGVATMPMVNVWLDSQQCDVRESMQVLAVFEALVADKAPAICVPCRPTSPLHHYLEKLGYKNNGEFTLFTKEL